MQEKRLDSFRNDLQSAFCAANKIKIERKREFSCVERPCLKNAVYIVFASHRCLIQHIYIPESEARLLKDRERVLVRFSLKEIQKLKKFFVVIPGHL